MWDEHGNFIMPAPVTTPDRCDHKTQVFIPTANMPEVLVQTCVLCHAALGTTGPGDPELEAIGDSLGDPEGDEWDERFRWG